MSTTTQTTWTAYPCPDCSSSLPTLNVLQNHYREMHDSDWTAGYPSACHYCGTTHKRKDAYAYQRAERHFCKNPCFKNWRDEVDDTSRENPTMTAGNPIKTTCTHCGDPIARERHKLERGPTNRQFCDNDCQGKYRAEHFSGQNHPDWIGGRDLYIAISTLLSTTPWEKISQRVRDKQSECQMCGKCGENVRGYQNHAHHIIPILAGGTHADELLMTLCPSCHGKVEQFTETLYGIDRILTSSLD